MNDHHEELLKGITEQMKPVLDSSQQAIYIYTWMTRTKCATPGSPIFWDILLPKNGRESRKIC